MTTEFRDLRALATGAAALSDARFLEIVELFERIRHEPGIADALRLIRPRLAALRPPRRITAVRLFFLPVEDLLDDIGRYRRQVSRVSRATIEPCWRVVAQHLGSARLQQLDAKLATADGGDHAQMASLGDRLWRDGAQALDQALTVAAADSKQRFAMFGRDDDTLRQVSLVGQVAALGGVVQTLKMQLPDKPVVELGEYHVAVLRKAVLELAEEDIAQVFPVLLVLAARMQRPGDLIDLLADLRLPAPMPVREEMARDVGDIALQNLLRQADALPTLVREGLGTHDLARMAERLLDGLESMGEPIRRYNLRKHMPRVEQVKRDIAETLNRTILEPAEANLLGHLDALTAPATAATGPALPTPDQIEEAEEFARTFRRCGRLAPQLGLKAEHQKAVTVVTDAMQRKLVGVARRGLDAADADAQLVAILRLQELVAGPDAAMALLGDWEAARTPSAQAKPRHMPRR